jgi:hypothetical protein
MIGLGQELGLRGANCQESVAVRCRVVALESFAYLIDYYEYIMRVSGFYIDEGKTRGGEEIMEEGPPAIADIYPALSDKIGSRVCFYRAFFS